MNGEQEQRRMSRHDGCPADVPSSLTVRASRRGFFAGSLMGLGGVALAACNQGGSGPAEGDAARENSGQRATWHVRSGAPRQSGVTTPPGANGHWLGINLPKDATKETLRRALVVIDDAAGRFVGGSVPLTDIAVELAPKPGEMSVLVGVGPRVFTLPGMRAEKPTWLAPIPTMKTDAFEKPWDQSDLVVQIDGPNPVEVSHVATQLAASIKGIGSIVWQQRGFRAAARPSDGGVTRNLFGQLDGQEQPNVDGNEARVVWNSGTERSRWLEASTGMVIRRIRMDVDTWESLDRDAQENSVGRRLSNGAPLTGTKPTDPVDLTKTDSLGLSVINPAAHVPRAMPKKSGERILRRPFNYEDLRADGTSDRGLVFVAFCADMTQQFVPIQQRLAEADLLNTWTTTVGSAVYLVPPAPRPGRYLGQELIEA